MHATDTLWHAYIDFLTYSDDHPSRQSRLCPSRERSRTSTKDINGLYRSFPAVFERLSASKGYTMHYQCRCITLRCRLVVYDPRELTYELTRFHLGAGASRLACTQQTHCGMHTLIFSHTQMTTRAGSLVYVRVESGRERVRRT